MYTDAVMQLQVYIQLVCSVHNGNWVDLVDRSYNQSDDKRAENALCIMFNN